MNNRNMINPANYYNPFAKYNYVSKTRGVYIPKDTQPLLNNTQVKSVSIYSENYDAETDLNLAMKSEIEGKGLLKIFQDFFHISNKSV